MSTTTRLGAGRYVTPQVIPENTTTAVHELTTADDATVGGVLRVVPGAQTVMCLIHPRQDFTHHVLVPELLARGVAVWTQTTRSPNNDINLIHEQAVLDLAAGLVYLRERGFDHIITVGHSGGGTLTALYHQQANLPPAQRISHTPAGRPIGLASASLPLPDAAVFVAPHPGQAALLQRVIDPSVTDETDPLSVDPDLDPYNPANGFAQPPTSSTYSPEFVTQYRAAQRTRIERLDLHAHELAADAARARERFKTGGDIAERRRSLAPRILTVYRTDADLRSVDLSLDPNERPYGSLFGSRPDIINYGLVGFGRLSTPAAWLSSWSAPSTNADFLRCAPGVTAPTLLIELSGDQACFPNDVQNMLASFDATDVTHRKVRGKHFGAPITEGEPPGSILAAEEIGEWLDTRFPVAD